MYVNYNIKELLCDVKHRVNVCLALMCSAIHKVQNIRCFTESQTVKNIQY